MSNPNLLEIAESALKLARSYGADAGDAMAVGSTQMTARQRLAKPEVLERAESLGLGLRVLVRADKGFRQAGVSTSDTSPEAIAELVERAVAMARVAPPDQYLALAPSEMLARSIPELDLCAELEPTAEWLKAQAAKAEEAALATPGITNSDGAEASYDRTELALVTSNGFARTQVATDFSLSLGVVAGEGTHMETDYEYSSARHAEDITEAGALGRMAAERTLKKLQPRKQKTAQIPVIFEPRVARSLLHEFSSAISGAAVARGTSFLDKYLGKAVFAKGITIVDDPLRKRGLNSEPFDGEGVQGRKRQLIEDGVLTTWLLDMRSGTQLGLATTGHSSRGLGGASSPSSTNLYLQAGKLSPAELMADIREGFYITDAFGMGVNGVTGDYSQGASGFWIEKGKLTYAVSEMTIAGNLKDMFLKLTPANDLEFKYGTNSPTVRIEGMMVAGS